MRLVVQNFGPLKDVDIEIKDIMVFIGPQASGKSTLAKIMAIFSNEFLDQSKASNLFRDYNIQFFFLKNTFISYDERISYSDGRVFFSQEYEQSKNNVLSEITDSSKTEFHRWESYASAMRRQYITPFHYIPAERVFVSTFSESLMTMLSNNIPIPRFLLKFGELFERARSDIKNINIYADIKSINIEYVFENGGDYIRLANSAIIPFEQVSSGLQALVPLYLVVKNINMQYKSILLIEEPELNLYPETQKQVVEYIISQCAQARLVITTHSPYVLTSINNLIQAGNVAKQKPHLEAEVEKIINKNKWIDFDKIGVYYVADGTAKDILDYENNVIGTHHIDDVSEELGAEFEQLLRLKYNA